MKRTAIAIAIVAAATLAGCSSSSPDAPAESSAPAEPETQTVTVTIDDATPLNAYFNLDDEQCHAGQLGASEVEAPEVTIADGEGNILAAQDGPDVGGTFTDGQGCSVDVVFEDVPVADVYTVTVNVSTGESFDRTASGSDITVTM